MLPDHDGDEATLYRARKKTANRSHVCCECGDTIKPRDQYHHAAMLFDGSWGTYKTCLACVDIGDHFTWTSRAIECLWEEMDEFVFPETDMQEIEKDCRKLREKNPDAAHKLMSEYQRYLSEREVDDADE